MQHMGKKPWAPTSSVLSPARWNPFSNYSRGTCGNTCVLFAVLGFQNGTGKKEVKKWATVQISEHLHWWNSASGITHADRPSSRLHNLHRKRKRRLRLASYLIRVVTFNGTAVILNKSAERRRKERGKFALSGKGRLSRAGKANEIVLSEFLPSTSSMAKSTAVIKKSFCSSWGQLHRWTRSDGLNAVVKCSGEWRDGAAAERRTLAVCARTDAHRQGERERRISEEWDSGYEPAWRVKYKMHKSYKCQIYVTFSSEYSW